MIDMGGACRCGRVRMQVTAAPVMTFACHCRGCQRMTASAFSLTALIPEAGFAVLAGSPVPAGARTPGIDHYHCPDCMSWLFTRAMPGMVGLRVPMLDDPARFPPFVETCTAEKLPWAVTPARHSYPGFPPAADMPALLADYAAQ